MEDREAIHRGEKAQAILDNPLWADAWKTYDDRIMQEFRDCRSDDKERLGHLKLLHLAGVAAKTYLEAALQDGRIASASLELEKPGLLTRLKRVM